MTEAVAKPKNESMEKFSNKENETERKDRLLDTPLSSSRDKNRNDRSGARKGERRNGDNRNNHRGGRRHRDRRRRSRSRDAHRHSRSPQRHSHNGGGPPQHHDRPRHGRFRSPVGLRDEEQYRGPANDHRGDERYHSDRHPSNNHNRTSSQAPLPNYRVVDQPKDEKLGNIQDDPRGEDPTRRITKKASSRGNGRNTESFDPASTLVRPDLRIHVGSNRDTKFSKPLKHDDVVIVPELFGAQDDWSLYYKLVEEMRSLQESGVKGSEWISWHEGAHLISKNPQGSKTFDEIIDRLCEYFNIRKQSIGTRFNWYKDSSDWKPFHHDSAAFNPQRAKNQNITVGVSFGATRELAFINATAQENGNKVKLYFPQTNNGVFSFGRDANILWKHGVNALPPEEQDGKGRISIILWGLAQDVIDEAGSPPLLGSDGQGPHAQRDRRRDHHRGSRGGGRH